MPRRYTKTIAPFEQYLLRLGRNALLAASLVMFSLGLGGMGYHHFEKLPWLDAFLNASMILTGMGPVNPVVTEGGKLFAIFYSLFSGVIFLTAVAVLFAPVAHRFLHRFHLDFEDEQEDTRDASRR